MANRLYNKQVSPKGYKMGGRVKKMGGGMMKKRSMLKSGSLKTVDKEKKARPERNKPERQGKSTGGQDKKSHQKHAKNVQEGDGLKFKKKDGKSSFFSKSACFFVPKGREGMCF